MSQILNQIKLKDRDLKFMVEECETEAGGYLGKQTLTWSLIRGLA